MVPQRLNYIHWLEDLLAERTETEEKEKEKEEESEKIVLGIDIGVCVCVCMCVSDTDELGSRCRGLLYLPSAGSSSEQLAFSGH